MRREPLIKRGAYLKPAEPEPEPDLLERVIQRDRQKNGRTAAEEKSENSEHITGNTVMQSYGNTLASKDHLEDEAVKVDSVAPVIEQELSKNTDSSEHITGNTVMQSYGNTLASGGDLTPAERDTAAIERVKSVVSGKTKTVTFKLDGGVDDYVTEFVSTRWRERFMKQDVLKRALMLWIYEQETGQQLVDFEDSDTSSGSSVNF